MDLTEMKNSIEQSPIYGGQQKGKPFNDKEDCAEKNLPFPKDIIVRKGDIIDQVTFAYNGFQKVHGGSGGSQMEFTLSEGEYIVKVTGSYCTYGGATTIKTLEFTTSKGRIFTVGATYKGDRTFCYEAKKGDGICALHGCADQFVRGIGFITRKSDMSLVEEIKDFGEKIPEMPKMPGM